MIGASNLMHIGSLALMLGMSSVAWAGDDDPWSISKSSGDVWVASTGAEQVSLNQEISLKPGDTIRTGPNGRVLLTRGEETLLIAPNSVVGLPTEKKDGMATTIMQHAGSILLDVEKRNVKHFEVETPYLVAVVKGTQFRVTVNAADTKVEVSRGQVEVSSFKSGQIAQILPGQSATAFAHGFTGLKLSGSGSFAPIEQGKPRASSIDTVKIPRGGLRAPSNPAAGTSIRALAPFDKSTGMRAMAKPVAREVSTNSSLRPGVVRISVPLGEVKLNVAKATHGLAHGVTAPGGPKSRTSSGGNNTLWSDSEAGKAGSGSVAQPSAGSGSNSGSSNNAASNGGSAGNAVAQTGGGGVSSGGVGVAGGIVGAANGVIGGATGAADGILSGATGNHGLHLGWGNGNGNSGGNGNNGNGNHGNGNGNGQH